jgi:hypothetical protein
MNTENAQSIVNRRSGHQLVIRALQKYHYDWKLCWFGCSAIWNMSRCEAARSKFDHSLVGVLINILQTHENRYQVVNTVMGSLSNLCLRYGFKLFIGQERFLNIIFKVIEKNATSEVVSSTTAGLLANLAVHDPIANKLVEYGAIRIISEMFKLKMDPLIQRNISSALNNCISSPKFFRECLWYRLIEPIVQIRDNSMDIATISLASNCLSALGVEDEEQTTSLHLLAFHGQYMILKETFCEEDIDNINVLDNRGNTCIFHAIVQNHIFCVDFLIKCGAEIPKIHPDIFQVRNSMLGSIHRSLNEVKQTRLEYEREFQNIRVKGSKCLPADVCNLVCNFIGNYHIMRSKNQLLRVDSPLSSTDMDES